MLQPNIRKMAAPVAALGFLVASAVLLGGIKAEACCNAPMDKSYVKYKYYCAGGVLIDNQDWQGFVGTRMAALPKTLRSRGCMVPCPCNFGQRPSPHDFCESLSFGEIKQGAMEGVALAGLRFAILSRSGSRAVVYLDSKASEAQRGGLRRIATWMLSFDGTLVTSVRTASISLELSDTRLRGSIGGTNIALSASALKGNDGKSGIIVSHPWIYGALPIASSRKSVADRLRAETQGTLFQL